MPRTRAAGMPNNAGSRQRQRPRGRHTACATVVVLTALQFGCDGPIVARSPEALYALAKEQIARVSYHAAVDTLAKVTREAPQSELAQRARVLRVALLGGMARAFKEIGESYLEGQREAGEAPHASQMRSVAMSYFGRARGRSMEMLEAVERLMRDAPAEPLGVDFPLPEVPAGGNPALANVRQGNWIEHQELLEAEREEMVRGLATVVAGLVDTDGDLARARERLRFHGTAFQVDPANLYLGAARELVHLSGIYGPEALRDERMLRLYRQRAAAVAQRATQRAAAIGNDRIRSESERLLSERRQALPEPERSRPR